MEAGAALTAEGARADRARAVLGAEGPLVLADEDAPLDGVVREVEAAREEVAVVVIEVAREEEDALEDDVVAVARDAVLLDVAREVLVVATLVVVAAAAVRVEVDVLITLLVVAVLVFGIVFVQEADVPAVLIAVGAEATRAGMAVIYVLRHR